MLTGTVGVMGRGSTRGHIPKLFRKKLEKAELLAWEPTFFNKQKVKGVVITMSIIFLYCMC